MADQHVHPRTQTYLGDGTWRLSEWRQDRARYVSVGTVTAGPNATASELWAARNASRNRPRSARGIARLCLDVQPDVAESISAEAELQGVSQAALVTNWARGLAGKKAKK